MRKPCSRQHQRSTVSCDLTLELLAQVVLLGKPAPAIYEVAMKMLGVQNSEEVLAIGDSLEHDIAGEPCHSRFALVQAMMLAKLRRTCCMVPADSCALCFCSLDSEAALRDDALYLMQVLKQQAATLSSLREAFMPTRQACS